MSETTWRAAAEQCVAAGDFAGALQASAAGLGAPLCRAPDLSLKARDPRQDMQYGESLVLARHPETLKPARALAARAVGRAPESAGLLALAGMIEALLGEHAAAVPLLDRALARDPRLAWAWAWRGAARALDCRRRKESRGLAAALSDLDRAVAAGGGAARFALPWRAELRHDLEDLRGALDDLERMLESEPGNLWARVERGEILCETRRVEEALEVFDQLVREYPKQAWAWSLRGRTLATSGREQDSLKDLTRAVRLAPRSAAARAWLGEALRKLARYQEALRVLDKAVRLDPRFVLAWIWRGRILLALGRPAEALKDLDRAVRLDPRYRLGLAWRGEARFKLGRSREACEDFKQVEPMDLRRTWNPLVAEGQPVTADARAKAYWDDVSRAVQRRPGDRWARRLWEQSLGRVPVCAPLPGEELVAT